MDVAFVNMFVALTTGTFLVGFVKYLGGNDYWVQLVVAVPTLVGLLQIPGAVVGRSFKEYRGFIGAGGLLWRLLYIPVAVLPLLALSNDLRLDILLLCVSVAAAAINFVSPIYNDWLGEIVPAESRGWFFSRRTLIMTVTGAVAGLVFGVALDAFKAARLEPQGYAFIFAMGVVFALFSFAYFWKMGRHEREHPVEPQWSATWRMVREPMRDRNFRKVLLFTAIFLASQGLAGNLPSAYAIEVLKLPFWLLQLTGLVSALGVVVFIRVWGFLADKYGNKPMLAIIMVGAVLTPGLWILCRPDDLHHNAVVLLVGMFFNGIVWSGASLTHFNLYLASAKPEDRANYLAAALAVQALAAGVSPLVGSALLTSLRVTHDAVTAYKIVFWTIMGVRVVAMVTLAPVHEPGATSLRKALKQFRRVTPQGVAALRTIRAGSDTGERVAALDRIGTTQFTLALAEVARALADPVPRVRRQAAATLGRMGSAEAAQALLDHMERHPELIEDETLEALGETGNAIAVPALITFLQHPRALLRRSAARSLGRIGDKTAIDALGVAASPESDPDLRRSALQSLRIMEARDATPIFAAALRDNNRSVRSAAAEAASEMVITELAVPLREALANHEPPQSEVAYALGCVGDIDDIPMILRSAAAAPNPTVRRRCLLAVARLLGVEADTYKVFSLEGISRDTELLNRLRFLTRRSEEVNQAFTRYSTGDEAGALADLARHVRTPAVQYLAETPVEEGFLVAVLSVARGSVATA
ncbi:MAG: MFS transporter [Fimbriimonadaceae bacterium]|nr:MFS transporter [Fimbriimonadaceae bacterium]